jgi:hypothetical protein
VAHPAPRRLDLAHRRRPIIKECHERINRLSPPEEHDNLLAVTTILTRLRYNDPELIAILGGKRSMLELPFLQEIFAEKLQGVVLSVLRERFEVVPDEIADLLRPIEDEAALDRLVRWAATCPDLDAFRARLTP